MKKLIPLFLLVATAAATAVTASAHAGSELDPTSANVPSGLIVQDDGHGNTQVFKADGITESQVTDAQSAQAAIAAYVTSANQVAKVVPQSELDQTSSDQAWYYYYNPVYNPYCGYNYGYNYYGYNYNYRPFYNYGYNNYYYYYYYRY
jgi:hypothetical protein